MSIDAYSRSEKGRETLTILASRISNPWAGRSLSAAEITELQPIITAFLKCFPSNKTTKRGLSANAVSSSTATIELLNWEF